MIIRLTKEFSFEMAHLLEGYNGKCSNVHGHSYRLFITICGTPCSDPASPTYGMVMDFSELKRIVNEYIIDPHEHALMLREGTQMDEALKGVCTKTVRVAYQPTCENMVVEFAKILRRRLPQNVQLHSVRLHETATSYAEWYAGDN